MTHDLPTADARRAPTIATPAEHTLGTALPPAAAHDELSDDDLDEVVGGLARTWTDRAIARLIRG